VTESSDTPAGAPGAAGEQAPPDASPSLAEPMPSSAYALPADRPEVAVGAAFAGGFILAMLLKRLAR
jgi:hypothetical protein